MKRFLDRTVLVMFSGGVDSTAVAKKALGEGEKVILYHIELKNKENRWKEESEHVQHIFEELKKKYKENVSLSVSIFDTRNIRLSADSRTYIPLAAAFANSNTGIAEVHVGFIKEDLPLYEYKEVFKLLSTSRATLVFPLKDWSKKQCLDSIGKLRDLTFSCRRPVDKGDCGKCTPCLSIASALREN